MSLKSKTSLAIKWSTVFTVLETVCFVGFNIILYRLLLPEDYGLFAINNVLLVFMRMTQDMGLVATLVREEHFDSESFSTAFWAMLALALLLMTVTVLGAPYVSLFYRQPRLTGLLMSSSFCFVLIALASMHRVILIRNLDFKYIRSFGFVMGLANSVCAVLLAYLGFGVWSLVLGVLVSQLLNTVLYWLKVAWRPALCFNVQKFKGMLGFGVNVSGVKVVGFLKQYFDQLVIGKFLGITNLGVYSFGYKAMNRPLTQLSNVFLQVLLPAFSSVQAEPVRLKSGYLDLMHYIVCLVLPILVGIALLSTEIVQVIFGNKWLPAVPLIKFFCIASVFESLFQFNIILCHAVGRPATVFRIQSFLFVAYGLLLISFVSYGLQVVVKLVALTAFFSCLSLQVFVNRTLGLSVAEIGRALALPVIITIVMVVILFLGKEFAGFRAVALPMRLSLLVVLGATVYTGGMLLFNQARIREVWQLLRKTA